MSLHAGAERNVCYIVVCTETPKSTTNPSQAAPHVQTSTLTPVSPPRLPQTLAQPLAQMCYRCKYQVSSTEVCLYNLSISTCEFVTTNPISLRIFKVSPELSLLAHTLCVLAAKALVKFKKKSAGLLDS